MRQCHNNLLPSYMLLWAIREYGPTGEEPNLNNPAFRCTSCGETYLSDELMDREGFPYCGRCDDDDPHHNRLAELSRGPQHEDDIPF